MTTPIFINETGFIGIMIIGLNQITGSLFLTILSIMLLLFVVAAAIRIPLLSTGIIILPILLASTSFIGAELLPLLTLFIIYLGVGLADLFFKR